MNEINQHKKKNINKRFNKMETIKNVMKHLRQTKIFKIDN